MCGRFAFYSPAEAAAALFGARDGIDIEASWNVAPTQELAAVRASAEDARELVSLRWGLVPFWAKDPSIGNRMINARAETLADKPSFRNAYRKRRCLVLADGFYEWHRDGGSKVPWYISLPDRRPMAFAGLWERWTDKETGETLETATIVTTDANPFMAKLHQRMPVVLEPDTASRWLGMDDQLLGDYASVVPDLRAWPVSRRVNSPANNDASLIEPEGDEISG